MNGTIWRLLAISCLVVAVPTVTDAQPQATCKAICQRFTDCKTSISTSKCVDYCKQQGLDASEEGRTQLVAMTRASCKQVQQIASAIQSTLDQHQPSSPRTPSPRNPPRHNGEMDQLAAGSSSRAGDNCAPVCDRFEQCRLWKHDSCMSYCSSNTKDPTKNLSAAQWSCPKLAAWLQDLGVAAGSGGWMCTAEASVGTTHGSLSTIYRNISAHGKGPNRKAASAKALEDCGALVTAQLSLAGSSGATTEGGTCAISRCIQSQ